MTHEAIVVLQDVGEDLDLLFHHREAGFVFGELAPAIEDHPEHEEAVEPDRPFPEDAVVTDAAFIGARRNLVEVLERVVDNFPICRFLLFGRAERSILEQSNCRDCGWAAVAPDERVALADVVIEP
jgi:hypothetical protein